jgi:hypothetical protein
MHLVSIPANPVPDGAVTGMLKTRDGVRLVGGDGDLHRRDVADTHLRQRRAVAPVDEAARQMPQEVDDLGSVAFVLPEQPGKGALQLRADARQLGHRGKQRVEFGRPHLPLAE